MIVINSKIHARPAKRQELLQTLHELAAEKRALRGFVDCRICMEGGNPDWFTLIEEWTDSEAVAQYQQSPYFRIFIGAQTVLAHSVESAMFEVPDALTHEVMGMAVRRRQKRSSRKEIML